jgi:hypothetical protein
VCDYAANLMIRVGVRRVCRVHASPNHQTAVQTFTLRYTTAASCAWPLGLE